LGVPVREGEADDTDPRVVFAEDSATTHWGPKEMRLNDERTQVLDPF